ncbi:MAG: hypothetical protein Q9162_003484 [Coniocarpon cinnabarinum]
MLALHKSTAVISLFLSSLTGAVPQASSPSSTALPTATPYYTFPPGTNVENLALRSNGGILANIISAPQIAYIPPSPPADSEAPVIASFGPPANGVLGVAEMEDDVFYVVTERDNLTTSIPTNGTGQVWRLDLRGCDDDVVEGKVTPELVANVKDSGLLNGVDAIKEIGVLLLADSIAGKIWRIEVSTGDISVAIEDELTAVDLSAQFRLGANGVHVQDSYAYFTNTGLQLYARTPISPAGYGTGPSEVLNQGSSSPAPDDFALTGQGSGAFITDADLMGVIRFEGNSGIAPLVATGTRPTAARLGMRCGDEDVLYISTAGNETFGGGIETYKYV